MTAAAPTIPSKTLAELHAVLPGGVEEHAPFELDGEKLSVTLRPADRGELARAVGSLGRLGLAAVVCGGGSRAGFGNPPIRAEVILSTERLAGIAEFDATEGVCLVLAGTPLADVRAAVEPEGWDLPFDAPGPGATVGGVLAAAAIGPRALGFGLPRDLVLGLDVVLASGERTRCGGRVVKNVTGYDLAKLYVGSFGTLGVIEGAWLRLRPRPARSAVFEAHSGSLLEGCAGALAAARRATARASSIAHGAGESESRIVVEFAGSASAVERDAAWAIDSLAALEVDVSALERVRDLQAEGPGLRLRHSLLPSKLPAVLESLAAAGARLLAYPGLGLAWAGFPLEEEDVAGADAVFRSAERMAADFGGSFVCEEAPLWVKRDRDVFGDLGPTFRLVRGIKERWDPGRVLNPGRFVGRL